MPNRYQFAFLASLFLTFTSLVLVSRFINKKLVEAGYDISRLILIGLDPVSSSSAPNLTDTDMGQTNVPGYGPVDTEALQAYFKNLSRDDLVALASTPAFLATVGLIFAAFVFTQVILKSLRHFASFQRPRTHS